MISILSFSLLGLSHNKPVGQEVNPYFIFCSLSWLFVALLHKYLPMFQDCCQVVFFCFGVLVGVFLITLSLKHWFIAKKNYLVSNFCLLGKGNYWQWTLGSYTPTEQQANNSVSSASQKQWRGNSPEPFISCVWPESRAFRARRMRTF